ncbi:MAG: hypothetical protein V1709_00720 [Planctomycetota bacterium]
MITIKFGNFTFPSKSSLNAWLETAHSKIDLTYIPKRHGATISLPIPLDVRRVTVSGRIRAKSQAEFETALNTLTYYINQGTQKLQFWNDRFVWATKSDFSGPNYRKATKGLLADYSIWFICEDPFVYAIGVTGGGYTYTADGERVDTQTIAGATLSFMHENRGFGTMFPVYTLTVGGGNALDSGFRITNYAPIPQVFAVATTPQTFTLTNPYVLGNGSLAIYKDGVKLIKDTDYTEVNTTSFISLTATVGETLIATVPTTAGKFIQFNAPLAAGDILIINTKNLKFTVNGVNAIDSISDDSTVTLPIVFGVNSFVLSAMGASAGGSFVTQYFERFN